MKKIAISILFGILFVTALIYVPIVTDFSIENFTNAINGYGLTFSILTLSVSYVFYKLITGKEKIKFNVIIAVTSLFLSTCLVIGKYYINEFTLSALFSSFFVFIINIVLTIVFFIALYVVIFNLYEYCNNYEEKKETPRTCFSKIIDFVLNKHSFLMPFLIILICGIPYIVFFYPGSVQFDGNVQLQQFLNNLGRTAHHPYVSTMILGACFQLGRALGSDNFGIFIFTFTQFIFSSLILAYSIDFLKKINAPIVLRFIALLYFSLYTMWPINAYTFVKDTMYYLIFLYIVIYIFQYVSKEENQISKEFNFEFAFLCILLCMFRNNGIEIVLLSILGMFFLNKNKKRIAILACVFLTISAYHYIAQPLIYKALQVEEGSIREALSVPLQQIALTVSRHGNEIEKEDKLFIEAIHHQTFDGIKERYEPEISDAIKGTFEVFPEKGDLAKYFGIWFKYLLRYPSTYVDAYLNNYYGYFYPDRMEYKDGLGWYSCSITIMSGVATDVDVHFVDEFEPARNVIEQFSYFVRGIPFVGLFYSTGIYTWLLIIVFSYLLYIKKYKYILVLLPSILTLVICCLSPVDAYIRYSQPIMVNMPILLSFLFNKKNLI